MKRYYQRTCVGLAVVLVGLSTAAVVANSLAARTKRRYESILATTATERRAHAEQAAKVRSLEAAMTPVRQFATAWKKPMGIAEKEAAERIQSDLEAIAQRQLGLITDSAITPSPDRYLFQGEPIRVQRVSLRASGKDLAALIAWLGKVEERYPAALVEQGEFLSNVGGSTGLTLRIVQPVMEPPAPRSATLTLVPDAAALPEVIRTVRWANYLPTTVKAPVAVGFQRNPLQPAIATDARVVPALRSGSEDVEPRLEMALEGRIRSVVRGAAPIVVVDGRVFRVGDEVVLGPAREKPVAGTKTKLKHIGDDRLVFHIAGGTADRPIQCEAIYVLPPFLRSR